MTSYTIRAQQCDRCNGQTLTVIHHGTPSGDGFDLGPLGERQSARLYHYVVIVGDIPARIYGPSVQAGQKGPGVLSWHETRARAEAKALSFSTRTGAACAVVSIDDALSACDVPIAIV